jgi:mannose-6-phosphate isomerase-like protein (cupin superfamily)
VSLAAAVYLSFANAQAQAPARGGGQGQPGRPPAATNLFLLQAGPETRMVNGKVVSWTLEELNKGKSHILWAPEYRVTMTTRQGAQPGQEPVHGELHTDNTQIYVITGGSGTVLVEGTVDKADDYLVAPGEHRGGPIKNGRKIKVKVGDVVAIPPYAWHIGYGDPGVPLTYMMLHVHTRQTIP